MKKAVLLFILVFACSFLFSQDMSKFNLYHPDDNAEKDISEAIKTAKKEGKHVFIQIGGNWCIWCARFDDYIKTDKQIDSIINADFVVYHLNYSKENYNAKLLSKYKYPQRFGFPVFLILNGGGELLHTQNSAYLEDGAKSYNRREVIGFLLDWRPAALNSDQYKEQ
jgi:thiol:disulfide interchange protein